MQRKTNTLLLDALLALREIEGFTAELTREDFDRQRGTQLIVERLLITVGEALSQAQASDPTLAARIPELWNVIGMRNRIVHGYRDVDDDIVWDVVVRKGPYLATAIQLILDSDT